MTALSNSHSQRRFIERRCRDQHLTNVSVITCNVADFSPERRFDRVVSIEMFEHVRNYDELLRRISTWLTPQGKLFVHIFCHRSRAYAFEDQGPQDWMSRHFFTGGIMPAASLLAAFTRDLQIDNQWVVDGRHYSRTCECWLRRLDTQIEDLHRLFDEQALHPASVALQRWRMFFMACSELFRFRRGNEWFVQHTLLEQART